MGELRKKINGWRLGVMSVLVAFFCLMMTVGVSLLNLQSIFRNKTLSAVENSDADIYWVDDMRASFVPAGNNTYYINSAAHLAYLNFVLTSSGANASSSEDFNGCTFILGADIQLDHIYYAALKKYITPLWTPIDIGNNGKNQNIIFEGNHHKITGLTIRYDDSTPRHVGLFADIVGGVFQNVTFENPVIQYTYKGNSPAHADVPTDVCVGVIAGTADSTYINNVEIVNPTIEFTTENSNGHNFYVGTAVGKLSFSSELVENEKDDENDKNNEGETVSATSNESENKVIKSTNTITPKQWGLDTVNVSIDDKVVRSDDDYEPGVTMTVNAGTKAGSSYGLGTKGYLGGLVGANISSKIINSTVRDLSIVPELNTNASDSKLAGTYYVGGLAGLTTQIATDEDLLVAAGFYNNLLIDVDLTNAIGNTSVTFGGSIVGHVFAGGWVYNNIVIGTKTYQNFWDKVYNSKIFLVNESPDFHCIAKINGGVDSYYLPRNIVNTLYPECEYTDGLVSGISYPHCSTPGHANEIPLDSSATESRMKNFYFTSTDSTEYNEFLNKKVHEDYTESQLVNNFAIESGHLYRTLTPIVLYEVGLTVNKYNPDIKDELIELTDEERRLEAVYQFRKWDFDSKDEPSFGDYLGSDYSITFVANSSEHPDAGWLVENSYGGFEYTYQLDVKRTFQQVIYRPEDPTCVGYYLKGWKIKGLEDNPDKYDEMRNKKYIDQDGYYNFYPKGEEKIEEAGRCYYAVWGREEYTVHFMRDAETEIGTEKVLYNDPVTNAPDDPTLAGHSFAGWFLWNDLEEGKDADPSKQWVIGAESYNVMPAGDIWLFAGWIDNFAKLTQLLKSNQKYQTYSSEEYAKYFNDDTWLKFKQAYNNAKAADEHSNNTDQLLEDLIDKFNGLRIAPEKLLGLRAFNEDLGENAYPFLYDYNFRLKYNATKNSVRNYVESADTTDIEGFIQLYDDLEDLFDSLKDNLNPSVQSADGIEAPEVQNLIKKYEDLKKKVKALDKTQYDADSVTKLEEAIDKVNELWTTDSTNPNLKDIELAVNAYESAFNGLKPKGTNGGNHNSNSGNGNGNSSNNNAGDEISPAAQLPVSPMILGILGVAVIMAGVGGFIGFDIMKNKRRVAKVQKTKAAVTKQMASASDDDDYI